MQSALLTCRGLTTASDAALAAMASVGVRCWPDGSAMMPSIHWAKVKCGVDVVGMAAAEAAMTSTAQRGLEKWTMVTEIR